VGPTLIRKASKAFALVIALVMALSVAACRGSDEPSVGSSPTGSLPRGTVTIGSASGERIFRVEIAETDADRQRGLMFREELDPDAGMAFLFESPVNGSFWMKNTLIPLDMIFINGDRQVVAMHESVPPCRRDPCPGYDSGAPARFVLELAGGTAKRLKLRPGDKIFIPID
jgi:hypothetical protein